MDRNAKPDIHRSEQGVLNRSFDETYQVLAVEQLVHNSETNNLDRQKQALTDDELRAAPVPTTDSTAQALLQQIESNTELLAQLAVVVKSLQQATVDPPYLDKSANAIRNQVQSGTITTVTTVTGMTNIDSYQGKLLMVGQDISAWANVVRGRIT